jgi:putative methionine-R-sulfoxide reductase with GAF domain
VQSLGTNAAEIGLQATSAHDRRRRVRHKVQLPAYASLDGTATGPALDLSAIINLSEDGMAIQTSSPLEVDQQATFFLDLPETNAFIRTEGKVRWAGFSGRAGIQFSEMQKELNFSLKRWLFANAIAGCVNHAAESSESRVSPVATSASEEISIPVERGAALTDLEQPVRPDYTSTLSALAAVKREVEALANDLDAALFLLARRAQTFTRASGAAIALTEGEDMVCRANAGLDAPPLGAHLKIGSGFSGECVRTGILLRCDDAENDSRVDRQSCRTLGIRSMVAVPIRSDGGIIGLLEVLSPEANAFGPNDEFVLPRLAEMISQAADKAGSKVEDPPSKLANLDDEFPAEDRADLSLSERSRSRNVLLIAAAITIVFVVLWLLGTWGGNRPHRATTVLSSEQAKPVPQAPPASAAADFPSLRRLADQGDSTAQFAVGARYATGEDVPQDYAEAVRWFTKAAEQGHVGAQATLGAYYWAGRGVPVDLTQAYFWSLLAETGGDEASKSRVALLASRLTHAQIVTIQEQANDWIKQHQLTGKSSPPAQ